MILKLTGVKWFHVIWTCYNLKLNLTNYTSMVLAVFIRLFLHNTTHLQSEVTIFRWVWCNKIIKLKNLKLILQTNWHNIVEHLCSSKLIWSNGNLKSCRPVILRQGLAAHEGHEFKPLSHVVHVCQHVVAGYQVLLLIFSGRVKQNLHWMFESYVNVTILKWPIQKINAINS